MLSAPTKPYSSRRRCHTRWAVCRCFFGRWRSSASHWSISGMTSPSTGEERGDARVYLRGSASCSAAATTVRLWSLLPSDLPNALAFSIVRLANLFDLFHPQHPLGRHLLVVPNLRRIPVR